jgi:hypothetical protein
MVNVTDGADVAVRLRPLKFSLCHFSNLLTLEMSDYVQMGRAC